jgi:glutamine synthetase
MRLQFTDILGINKNVEIPSSQFEKALAGDIMFDGSSIEGFVRIEESDMLLAPDLDTFLVYPWGEKDKRICRLICDIHSPSGEPFAGDPRGRLKAVVRKAKAMGFTMNAGMEAEFFLFRPDASGEATTATHDVGGYFDLAPTDLGEDARRAMVDTLEQMGFEVEAAHHEVAHGQHEIDFRYADALKTADNIATFRFVVKHVATQFGLLASFMPKPIFGQNGSGMHTHQSLFTGDRNSFFEAEDEAHISATARAYMAGLLRHAPEITLVTNQWVNSYKRLIPGYEAPVYACWARRNRSALVRVPMYKPGKEAATRIEYRSPDPACNPYLAFAVMLAAGLEGIENSYDLAPEASNNIFEMTEEERRIAGIASLPEDLYEAIKLADGSKVLRDALGEHVHEFLIRNKREEWDGYKAYVTPYELERYLPIL